MGMACVQQVPSRSALIPTVVEIPGPPPYYVDAVEFQGSQYQDPDNPPGVYWTYYGALMEDFEYGTTNIFSFVDGNVAREPTR